MYIYIPNQTEHWLHVVSARDPKTHFFTPPGHPRPFIGVNPKP